MSSSKSTKGKSNGGAGKGKHKTHGRGADGTVKKVTGSVAALFTIGNKDSEPLSVELQNSLQGKVDSLERFMKRAYQKLSLRMKKVDDKYNLQFTAWGFEVLQQGMQRFVLEEDSAADTSCGSADGAGMDIDSEGKSSCSASDGGESASSGGSECGDDDDDDDEEDVLSSSSVSSSGDSWHDGVSDEDDDDDNEAVEGETVDAKSSSSSGESDGSESSSQSACEEGSDSDGSSSGSSDDESGSDTTSVSATPSPVACRAMPAQTSAACKKEGKRAEEDRPASLTETKGGAKKQANKKMGSTVCQSQHERDARKDSREVETAGACADATPVAETGKRAAKQLERQVSSQRQQQASPESPRKKKCKVEDRQRELKDVCKALDFSGQAVGEKKCESDASENEDEEHCEEQNKQGAEQESRAEQ